MDYYLPDTAITAMAVGGKEVYAYVQIMSGALVECEGVLEGNPEVYAFEQHNPVMARYRRGKELEDAPKLYTPLAAAYLKDARYVFYIDDKNYLRDRYISPQTNHKWVAGRLFSDRAILVAQYSKLAAITVSNRWGDSICVYYQAPGEDAAIESVNFKHGQTRWEVDTTRVTDPPLYGTSLTAVLARDGIQLDKSVPFNPDSLPVVYLQWHSLELAHAQGKDVRRMEDWKLHFAPHTSLSAVDNEGGLQYFYTSAKDNFIRRVIINDQGKMDYSPNLATPTPRSAIAAVSVKKGKVMLFYQALEDRITEKVLLFGVLLSHSNGVWDGSASRALAADAAVELR